jgi:uncharacterized membrane protein YeaQ/YmgE (transglycosylase-associated protein family)
VLAVGQGWLSNVPAGIAGGIFTFGLFLFELRKDRKVQTVTVSRVFAGFLCAVVVFLLFWFP